MQKVILKNLQSSEYEHAFDKEAMKTLKKVPNLELVVKKVNEFGLDKIVYMESLANKIRVSAEQFPEIDRLFTAARKILDIPYHVDLYIEQSFSFNAYATGVEKPQVTVTTELINHFTSEELLFVLGHELGHVKSEHVLYHQMGRYFSIIAEILANATLGLGRVLSVGLQVALFDWIKKSEFSADRAGVLVAQNDEASMKAFCKLAGVPEKWLGSFNMAEVNQQVAEFHTFVNDSQINKAFQFFNQMFDTHPWIMIRIHEINQWIGSPEYQRIFDLRKNKLTGG